MLKLKISVCAIQIPGIIISSKACYKVTWMFCKINISYSDSFFLIGLMKDIWLFVTKKDTIVKGLI